jgi:hypothetical protein
VAEHRAVLLVEQRGLHLDDAVGADAENLAVVGSVVDLAQAIHGTALLVPRRHTDRPNTEFLAER